MPRAREWADEFEEGIKKYGISADQIQRYNDADYDTMRNLFNFDVSDKIFENAEQGRRTLLLCFYAGHGAIQEQSNYKYTWALFNSNVGERSQGGNQFNLEGEMDDYARRKGTYIISLFACSREAMPEKEEEGTRGGTQANDYGQYIKIHAVPGGFWGSISPETPSLAKEFLQQLEESKAPNGCIMLPGNLQYWQPCIAGKKEINIVEPIHFGGPSPQDQSAIAEEE